MDISRKEQFWNNRFLEKQDIWGSEPAKISFEYINILNESNVNDILIAGAGYGRNGKYFVEKGYRVDGIEISEEAIRIGKAFVPEMNFIHGDIVRAELDKTYDAVFCYDILQLFLKNEREIIVENCIKYCKEDGIILFSCLSTEDILYSKGREIEKHTFELADGLTVHFADEPEMRAISRQLVVQTLYQGIEQDRTRIYGIYRRNKER